MPRCVIWDIKQQQCQNQIAILCHCRIAGRCPGSVSCWQTSLRPQLVRPPSQVHTRQEELAVQCHCSQAKVWEATSDLWRHSNSLNSQFQADQMDGCRMSLTAFSPNIISLDAPSLGHVLVPSLSGPKTPFLQPKMILCNHSARSTPSLACSTAVMHTGPGTLAQNLQIMSLSKLLPSDGSTSAKCSMMESSQCGLLCRDTCCTLLCSHFLTTWASLLLNLLRFWQQTTTTSFNDCVQHNGQQPSRSSPMFPWHHGWPTLGTTHRPYPGKEPLWQVTQQLHSPGPQFFLSPPIQDAERSFVCSHRVVQNGARNVGQFDHMRTCQRHSFLPSPWPCLSQWRIWQGMHPSQESLLHHCPSSHQVQMFSWHQERGPALVNQQVSPQAQQGDLSWRGAPEVARPGPLTAQPSPSSPSIHHLSLPATWCISLEPSSSYLWSNSTPKEVVFQSVYLFVSISLKWISKEFHDVFCCSCFLLLVWVQSCFAMTCSNLPCGQWGAAVPHRVSFEVSFKTALGHRWLQFTLMMLIFELTKNQIAIKASAIAFIQQTNSSFNGHSCSKENIPIPMSRIGFWMVTPMRMPAPATAVKLVKVLSGCTSQRRDDHCRMNNPPKANFRRTTFLYGVGPMTLKITHRRVIKVISSN